MSLAAEIPRARGPGPPPPLQLLSRSEPRQAAWAGVRGEAGAVIELQSQTDIVKREVIYDRNNPAEASSSLEKLFEFDSNFECGNLRRVEQVVRKGRHVGKDDFEFNLFVESDPVLETGQWFFFRLKIGSRKSCVINICNLTARLGQDSSPFGRGARPAVISEKAFKNQRIGWRRVGESISYFKTPSHVLDSICKKKSSDMFFTLSFRLDAEYSRDTLFVAASIPYSYSQLQSTISSLKSVASAVGAKRLSSFDLCVTNSGLKCHLLSITEGAENEPISRVPTANANSTSVESEINSDRNDSGLGAEGMNNEIEKVIHFIQEKEKSRANLASSNASRGRSASQDDVNRNSERVDRGSSKQSRRKISTAESKSTKVSNKSYKYNSNKPVVFIVSRSRPDETTASYVCEGLMKFLCSDDPRALLLRHKFEFLVVPMLNPDGVVYGRSQTSNEGFDFSRHWKTPDSNFQKSIVQCKKLLSDLQNIGQLFAFIEIRRENSNEQFSISSSTWENSLPVMELIERIGEFSVPIYDESQVNERLVRDTDPRLLCLAIAKRCKLFQLENCGFSDSKIESCGSPRLAIRKELKIPLSAAVNIPNFYNFNSFKFHTDIAMLSRLGKLICLGLMDIYNISLNSRLFDFEEDEDEVTCAFEDADFFKSFDHISRIIAFWEDSFEIPEEESEKIQEEYEQILSERFKLFENMKAMKSNELFVSAVSIKQDTRVHENSSVSDNVGLFTQEILDNMSTLDIRSDATTVEEANLSHQIGSISSSEIFSESLSVKSISIPRQQPIPTYTPHFVRPIETVKNNSSDSSKFEELKPKANNETDVNFESGNAPNPVSSPSKIGFTMLSPRLNLQKEFGYIYGDNQNESLKNRLNIQLSRNSESKGLRGKSLGSPRASVQFSLPLSARTANPRDQFEEIDKNDDSLLYSVQQAAVSDVESMHNPQNIDHPILFSDCSNNLSVASELSCWDDWTLDDLVTLQEKLKNQDAKIERAVKDHFVKDINFQVVMNCLIDKKLNDLNQSDLMKDVDTAEIDDTPSPFLRGSKQKILQRPVNNKRDIFKRKGSVRDTYMLQIAQKLEAELASRAEKKLMEEKMCEKILKKSIIVETKSPKKGKNFSQIDNSMAIDIKRILEFGNQIISGSRNRNETVLAIGSKAENIGRSKLSTPKTINLCLFDDNLPVEIPERENANVKIPEEMFKFLPDESESESSDHNIEIGNVANLLSAVPPPKICSIGLKKHKKEVKSNSKDADLVASAVSKPPDKPRSSQSSHFSRKGRQIIDEYKVSSVENIDVNQCNAFVDVISNHFENISNDLDSNVVFEQNSISANSMYANNNSSDEIIPSTIITAIKKRKAGKR